MVVRSLIIEGEGFLNPVNSSSVVEGEGFAMVSRREKCRRR